MNKIPVDKGEAELLRSVIEHNEQEQTGKTG